MKKNPTPPKGDEQQRIPMTLRIKQAQERARKYVNPNQSLADELPAERRLAASKE
jgi:hypothetical protein